jgi:hypothetical protein
MESTFPGTWSKLANDCALLRRQLGSVAADGGTPARAGSPTNRAPAALGTEIALDVFAPAAEEPAADKGSVHLSLPVNGTTDYITV